MKNVFANDEKVANKFDIAVGIGKRAQWLDSVFPFSCRRVESLQKQNPREVLKFLLTLQLSPAG